MKRVKDFIKKHKLIHNGDTVVVGVSGGPDSMALLHFLHTLQEGWNLTVVAAHVDHAFRGDASYEDLLYVRDYCHNRGIVFEGTRLDVPAYVEERGVSSQVGARELRYQFFEKVMRTYNADRLALGHHGDDQIETMLMREVRGSYGFQLGGIPVKRAFATGEIIRPFLSVTKRTLESYCDKSGLLPRIDASNTSDHYTRNRFRKTLLPFMKQENPNVHTVFQRRSEWLTEDERYLTEAAKEALAALVDTWQADRIVLRIDLFLRSAKPLQRRMIHLILNYLYNGNVTCILPHHVEQAMMLMHDSHPSHQLDFPKGLKMVRSYNHCRFSFADEGERSPYMKALPLGEEVDVPRGAIRSELCETLPVDQGNDVFVGDGDRITFPLRVRTRQKGDRIRLNNRSHKVKKIFIDHKIDRNDRDTWPIVEDAEGNILWVVGLKHSDIVNATKDTTRFLILTFTKFSKG